jgi:predicted DNA-binding transcriptional regulator AlpA
MRIIRRHELTEKLGHCLAHIYGLECAGLFPRRVHVGSRSSRARVLEHD